MRFFALQVVPGNPVLHAHARGRAEALSEFGKELGHELTDKPTGRVAEYSLDEWDEAVAHWVNPTVPIWKAR
jgi:hypothetical protein